jgi:hypothetical protein
MSQKPYMYNRNNPVQYGDPSGYEGCGPGTCGLPYNWKLRNPTAAEGRGLLILAGLFVLGIATAGIGDVAAVGVAPELEGTGMSADEAAEMLGQAATKEGNFTAGSATQTEANALGRTWVGRGAQLSKDGKALVRTTGNEKLVYRFPQLKSGLGKVQANLQRWVNGKLVSNAHIDITGH